MIDDDLVRLGLKGFYGYSSLEKTDMIGKTPIWMRSALTEVFEHRPFAAFDTASLEAMMTALLTLMDSDGCDLALVRPLFNHASAEHAKRPDRGTQ